MKLASRRVQRCGRTARTCTAVATRSDESAGKRKGRLSTARAAADERSRSDLSQRELRAAAGQISRFEARKLRL